MNLKNSDIEIRIIEPNLVQGLYNAIDIVAQEKIYLNITSAPRLEILMRQTKEMNFNIQTQFVAICGSSVVGWCDVLNIREEAGSLVGGLGMGVVPAFRRQLVGTKLLQKTLQESQKKLCRIELVVRKSNEVAVNLYSKFGFDIVNRLKDGIAVSDSNFDSFLMELAAQNKCNSRL